jgi:hypothetical protein
MKAKVARSLDAMLPGQFAIVKFKKEFLKTNRYPTLEDVRCFFRISNTALTIDTKMEQAKEELGCERVGFLTMYHDRTTKFLSTAQVVEEIKEEIEEMNAILHCDDVE